MLGFAAGVMLAASFFSLIIPGIAHAADQLSGAYVPAAIAASGVLLGAVAIAVAIPVPPILDNLIADLNAALVPRILDFPSGNGSRTYDIIGRRMISGDVLKCRREFESRFAERQALGGEREYELGGW